MQTLCCVPLSLVAVLAGCAGAEVPRTEDREAPAKASGSVRFSEHLIMDNYAYPYGIWASDLDRDGDLDLTSADYTPHNNLYWFENDGSGQFKRHFIQKDDPERLERHMVGDINHDQRPDVVIVKNLHGHLLWFQNPGGTEIRNQWKRHVITTQLAGAYSVALADLDADGDLDVAASSWRMGNQFAWFENPGKLHGGSPTQLIYEEGKEWRKHLIEANLSETRCIRMADVDGDGDADLLGTAPGAGLVLWYENSGAPKSRPWRRHVVDTDSRPMHGDPVDMDGDGDVDVAATAWGDSGQVVWLENSGDPKGEWTHHPLKTNWPRANMILLADLDGDKDLDVAAVAEHGSYEFRWWRNEGRSAEKPD